MLDASLGRFVTASLPPPVGTATVWCLAFAGRDLLLAQGPSGHADQLPRIDQALLDALRQDSLAAGGSAHYLGQLDGEDCWTLQRPPSASASAPAAAGGLAAMETRAQLAQLAQLVGWQPTGLRGALQRLPGAQGALAGRAAQVLEWDRSHRHCGACGTPTDLHPHERSRVCPACGHTAYPRVSPAMMALVWRPGELLLARGPHYTPGMYSALAGFVEAGESVEHCLHREVAEEVGVRVAAPRYYGSQSWPFPHSLMVAYTARWIEGEITPQAGEIEDARWFPLDALPQIPPPLSIAGHLIRDTVQGLREGRLPDGGA